MPLNHLQKNYIKKNFRKFSVSELAQNLKVEENEILKYAQKRWGGQRLEASQDTPEFNFKVFLKQNWLFFLFLGFLVITVYANSLSAAFVSDDIAEIAHSETIGQFSSVLSHPFGFIRPLLYWIIFQLGGLHPISFRLINVMFHLGTVFLIFILINIIHSRKTALFVAGIFAVHPILIEAVTWISGGNYPMYTFFFLLSFIFYLLSKKDKRFYFASILTFVLTLESHVEMSISLVLIFLIYEFVWGDLKKNWTKLVPYFILSLTWFFFKLTQIPERVTTLQSVHYQERGIDNPLIQIPVAITSYLQLIFFPKDLTLYHSELAFGQVEFIIRGLVFTGSILSLILSFKKNKSIFFWLSFFFISLMPTLTPFRLNWIVAERYVYLGILGIILVITLGLERLLQKKSLKHLYWIIFVCLLLALGTRTIFRNIDWQSEDNLWIATGKTSPSSPNTHNNLGDVYGRHGDKEGALREFSRAIELKPNYADAYHNLGNTYRELNQFDKALESYQKAAELNPNLWQSYQNMAALYFQAKQYDKAQEFIQKAISINPKNLNLYNNLGVVYLAMGEKDKAKQIFTQILGVDPQNKFAKQGLIEVSK